MYILVQNQLKATLCVCVSYYLLYRCYTACSANNNCKYFMIMWSFECDLSLYYYTICLPYSQHSLLLCGCGVYSRFLCIIIWFWLLIVLYHYIKKALEIHLTWFNLIWLLRDVFLSFVHPDLSSVVLFGACIDGVVLRDKSVHLLFYLRVMFCHAWAKEIIFIACALFKKQ